MEWELEVEKKQKESKDQFTQQAKSADINFDWTCFRDTDMEQVLTRARVADLAIVGQVATGENDNEINRSFFSHFTINVGKPVLFVPYDKVVGSKFEKVVVAWNGGRESARAITDALPLLTEAKAVCVLTITSKKDRNDELPDVDIAAFLARHKVKVELEKVEKLPAEAADFILSRIDLKSADLLVMGAFGRTRFSEFILGGMTRSMLKKMIVPVLMSH